eukprot:TRINITY_DN19649_c0_g1_i1.p2 TRINITY_DN19649_c0_g1~~TRINITY_DN19649_c0_g1_i1.p2  ORF type:complete len:247 (+),score=37.48 TRINITY_DN19649_c0_g1_i1:70-810(+)
MEATSMPLETPNSVWGRVLSIQSHVVSGYVGNKSAVFPLQLLGFDVDPVNSVQFSNHTGYASWRGEILDGATLWDLVEGMETHDLLRQTHVLTGYVGSPSFLRTIARIVEKLERQQPNLVYVCDPVLGDEGKLYVPKELVGIYREELFPHATIITPNQFEAEQLTGISIHSQEDALRACDKLHQMGPKTVFITSTSIATDESLVFFCSSLRHLDESGKPIRFRITFPHVKLYITGTGAMDPFGFPY